MINITDYKEGLTNITTQSELLAYTSKELFQSSIVFVFISVLLLMLIMGLIIISRDKANFYAIFIFSWLVAGTLLFFTFFFPVIPQFLDKILGGIL